MAGSLTQVMCRGSVGDGSPLCTEVFVGWEGSGDRCGVVWADALCFGVSGSEHSFGTGPCVCLWQVQ